MAGEVLLGAASPKLISAIILLTGEALLGAVSLKLISDRILLAGEALLAAVSFMDYLTCFIAPNYNNR